jgi:hypothetical protein
MKTPGRDAALKNKVMGLGAGNMGTSQTAVNAQNAAFDQMERIRAFDADQAANPRGRTGRAMGTRGRIVPGLGSGGYTGADPSSLRAPASNGYGSLMTRGQAGAMGRASQSGRMGRVPMGGMATQTRGFGPAALGQRAPLALPAAGQSMASPAGTGYGSIVTRGDVQRNMDGLAARARNRPGTALELYRGGPPAVMRGSQNAPVSRPPLALPAGPGGAGPGPGPTIRPPTTPNPAIRESLERSGKRGFSKRGLLIGAGAAVVAGLAYSGRRGEGSSGGRTSPYRY